jgi:hypothetical protein
MRLATPLERICEKWNQQTWAKGVSERQYSATTNKTVNDIKYGACDLSITRNTRGILYSRDTPIDVGIVSSAKMRSKIQLAARYNPAMHVYDDAYCKDEHNWNFWRVSFWVRRIVTIESRKETRRSEQTGKHTGRREIERRQCASWSNQKAQ